jgi:myosin-5
VSSLAYRGLATEGKDQTILVTGESGAGKTETVKIVMTHLATAQQTRPGGEAVGHSTAQDIVSRVCKSSPVFEAFGNAKVCFLNS